MQLALKLDLTQECQSKWKCVEETKLQRSKFKVSSLILLCTLRQYVGVFVVNCCVACKYIGFFNIIIIILDFSCFTVCGHGMFRWKLICDSMNICLLLYSFNETLREILPVKVDSLFSTVLTFCRQPSQHPCSIMQCWWSQPAWAWEKGTFTFQHFSRHWIETSAHRRHTAVFKLILIDLKEKLHICPPSQGGEMFLCQSAGH